MNNHCVDVLSTEDGKSSLVGVLDVVVDLFELFFNLLVFFVLGSKRFELQLLFKWSDRYVYILGALGFSR